MTINLTELRDEALGKHPIQALFAACAYPCPPCRKDPQQDVVAADDESGFTFDVDGLSDEALDMPTALSAFGQVPGCVLCFVNHHA